MPKLSDDRKRHLIGRLITALVEGEAIEVSNPATDLHLGAEPLEDRYVLVLAKEQREELGQFLRACYRPQDRQSDVEQLC
jgi:hypothetical protein